MCCLDLTKKLKTSPGTEHAIDPGSKVLEAVSITIFLNKATKSPNLYEGFQIESILLATQNKHLLETFKNGPNYFNGL